MSSEQSDDDVEIDFSKFTSFFKGKKKPPKEQPKQTKPSEEESNDLEDKKNAKPVEHEKKVEKKTEDDEVSLDLGFIKKMFKGNEKKSEKKDDDDIGFDPSSAVSFLKNKPWIITLILLVFVVWMTVDVRMASGGLHFTDRFAEDSVNQYFRNQVATQVSQQQPNLPAQVRDQLIADEYAKFYEQNSQTVQNQIYLTSLFFKNAWSDERPGECQQNFNWIQCKPYMPDIDPYYWYRYARNIEEKGHVGDEVRDGVQWDNHMLAPIGRPVLSPDIFHPQSLVFLHKILGIFIPGITLYQSVFFYPVIVSALSVIFVFLIARRISGNVGGLFAAAMFAYSFASLTRTLFGHGDTDAWVLFFPIVVTWAFLESFHDSRPIWIVGYSAFAGLVIGVYSTAWGGWWYIFNFIIAMSGFYFIYQVITHWKNIRGSIPAALRLPLVRNSVLIPATFFASSGIFVTLLNSFETFLFVPLSSLGFTRLKDAVLPTLWPNVLTTVAELNEGTLGSVIGTVGGPFLFFIALLGIGFTMLTIGRNNKQYLASDDTFFVVFIVVWYGGMMLLRNSISDILFLVLLFVPVLTRAIMAAIAKKRIDIGVAILLSIWFAGTTYATFKGIRFTLLLAPAFSVAFGVVFGILFTVLWRWLDSVMSLRTLYKAGIMTVIFGLFFFFWFWPPGMLYLGGGSISSGAYNIADNDVPIINDAWWKSLKTIEAESRPNAIITSWWDFGHHFKSIANRPVTFDGTTQDKPQAYWVGKTFLTSNEREAKGILQMLACGANSAFDTLKPHVGNDTARAVRILSRLTVNEKLPSLSILLSEGLSETQAISVLEYTHCDPPELFLISSEDMIGKAGVWAHFGAWDFMRADVWYNLRELPLENAVNNLETRYNLTKIQAEDIWYEAQTITNEPEANAWVSPWPGYLGTGGCNRITKEITQCPVNLQGQGFTLTYNETSHDATIGVVGQTQIKPTSIVWLDNDSVHIKRFENPGFGFSFAIVPGGDNRGFVAGSPELIEGMFTRTFYLQGHGLRYFEPLTHQTSITGTNIFVYKLNWKGGDIYTSDELFPPPPAPARTATFDYIGYLEDATIFDSSIANWQTKNVTPQTALENRNDSNPLTFTIGTGQVIRGVDLAVSQMKTNETKIVNVPPELGYGTDPDVHPLGNLTIIFKIHIRSIDP